jgi:hypothetical protein
MQEATVPAKSAIYIIIFQMAEAALLRELLKEILIV